jgi:hypothetical protein
MVRTYPTSADTWSFREKGQIGVDITRGVDLTGFEVEAIDGGIGKIDEATSQRRTRARGVLQHEPTRSPSLPRAGGQQLLHKAAKGWRVHIRVHRRCRSQPNARPRRRTLRTARRPASRAREEDPRGAACAQHRLPFIDLTRTTVKSSQSPANNHSFRWTRRHTRPYTR